MFQRFKNQVHQLEEVGKEVPEKPAGGKNKGKCTPTKAVVPPLGIRTHIYDEGSVTIFL